MDARKVALLPDVGPTGLAEVAIRADLSDALAFDQACSAVAAALLTQQQAAGVAVPESLDVRRARAVGILADPAHAQALVADPASFDARDLDADRPLARHIRLIVHLVPRQAEHPSDTTLSSADLEAATTAWVYSSERSGPRAQLAQVVSEWCSRPTTAVTVTPVIDLPRHTESTSTDVTEGQRMRATLRRPRCVFPSCSRQATACDIDHQVPADQGGASCDCNLHPLCRKHHRLKTFAGWQYLVLPPPVDQSGPPSYLWTDPHGQHLLVDHCGTRDVTPTTSGCRGER